jgi:hypothetical protein
LAIDELATGIDVAHVAALPFQHHHHHLLLQLVHLNQTHLLSHAVYKHVLMKFEELNILKEKADQFIMILHSVERRDPQKLVKFLLRCW